MATEKFKEACIEHGIDPATDLADSVRMDQTNNRILFISEKDGQDVCQYCFKPFDERDRQYESMEMPVGDAFVKVHKSCHEEKLIKKIKRAH